MPSIIRGSDNFDSSQPTPAISLIKTYQITSSVLQLDMADFADASSFKHYEFVLCNLTTTSDGAQLELWTSTNGTAYGDTWDWSGYRQQDTSALVAFSESGTNMKVGYSGNAPAELGFSGRFRFMSFHGAYGNASIEGQMGSLNRNTAAATTNFSGHQAALRNNTALRLKCNIGNLDGGHISVYGMI